MSKRMSLTLPVVIVVATMATLALAQPVEPPEPTGPDEWIPEVPFPPVCDPWETEPPPGVPGFVYNTNEALDVDGVTTVYASYEANPGGVDEMTRNINYEQSTTFTQDGAEQAKFRRKCAFVFQSNDSNTAYGYGALDAGYEARATKEYIELKVRTCAVYDAWVCGIYHFFLNSAGLGGTGYDSFGDPLIVEVPFTIVQPGKVALDAWYLSLDWFSEPFDYMSRTRLYAAIKANCKLRKVGGPVIFEYDDDDYQLDSQDLLEPGFYEMGWDVGGGGPEFGLEPGDYVFEVRYANESGAATWTYLDYWWGKTNASDRLYALLRFDRFIPYQDDPIDEEPIGR